MCQRSSRAMLWLSALLLTTEYTESTEGNLRDLFSVGLVSAVVSRTSADEVSAYLERHNLKPLLVIYLEQQLETLAPGDQRNDLTLRLASLYAEMLESTTDQAQRISLEERSRK